MANTAFLLGTDPQALDRARVAIRRRLESGAGTEAAGPL
jgi:hypothetical protein